MDILGYCAESIPVRVAPKLGQTRCNVGRLFAFRLLYKAPDLFPFPFSLVPFVRRSSAGRSRRPFGGSRRPSGCRPSGDSNRRSALSEAATAARVSTKTIAWLPPDPGVDLPHSRVLLAGRRVVGDDRSGDDADSGLRPRDVHRVQLLGDVLDATPLVDVVHPGDDHDRGRRRPKTSRSNRARIWSLRSPFTPRLSTVPSGCAFISQ